MLQAENLLDTLNLLVLHDLVVLGFSNVEELATKWEDTVVVTTDDTKTSDS